MNKVFMFALGAAVGSLVTWKIVEEKYKRIADEEIESVVEQFNERYNELFENDVKEVVEKEEDYVAEDVPWSSDEEKEEYEQQAEEYSVKTEPVKEYIAPYVISPEEFGEFGNTQRTLTYYSDYVLADEDDCMICDPEALVGDALDHFGEYEEDSVHVRDENIECDYEILKSEKTFGEIYKGDN